MKYWHLAYIIPLAFMLGMVTYAIIDEDFNENMIYSLIETGIMQGCKSSQTENVFGCYIDGIDFLYSSKGDKHE